MYVFTKRERESMYACELALACDKDDKVDDWREERRMNLSFVCITALIRSHHCFDHSTWVRTSLVARATIARSAGAVAVLCCGLDALSVWLSSV